MNCLKPRTINRDQPAKHVAPTKIKVIQNKLLKHGDIKKLLQSMSSSLNMYAIYKNFGLQFQPSVIQLSKQ